MIINKEMLRADLPEVKEVNGYCNIVLALLKPESITPETSYLSSWQTVNTIWYNNNHYLYQGWIELEFVLPPEHLQ